MIIVPNFLENIVHNKTFKLIYLNWKKSITFHYNSFPIFLSIFREVLPWSIFRLWLKQSLLPLIFIKIFRISIQNLTQCPKSMVAIFGSHRHRNFTSLKVLDIEIFGLGKNFIFFFWKIYLFLYLLNVIKPEKISFRSKNKFIEWKQGCTRPWLFFPWVRVHNKSKGPFNFTKFVSNLLFFTLNSMNVVLLCNKNRY